MRHYPIDEYDNKELNILNAEDWQINMLKLNPSYVSWGCFEDYMCNDKGWSGRVIVSDWKGLDFKLDNLNELVNFYFEIYRKNHTCTHCEGTFRNQATKQLGDDWYDFNNTGRRWYDKITDIEIEALIKAGRLWGLIENFRGYYDDVIQKWVNWINKELVECEKPNFPTAEEVNEWSKMKGGHDAINRSICVETRAKYLGIWGECEHCQEGYIYDEPKAKLALQLWYLHPRKGSSRGVYIEEIKEEELPIVISYLKEARDRNNNRFALIDSY